MPEPGLLLAVVAAGGLGGAVLLLVAGVRGTDVDPTRPPGRLRRLVAAPRSPLLGLRLAGGLLAGVLVGVVTGWPVAAAGLGGLVVFWPALMGGSADVRLQIVRLGAVVSWCEALRDTTMGHAGLEQAIPVTAANAAPAIRPALARLTGQLRANVPLEQALADLAADLDHCADLIIAALQMNALRRGDGLAGVLTNLAVAGREELDLRRKVTAGRPGDRRAVQLMVGIVAAVASFLMLFSPTYTAPFATVTGQLVLALVLGLFAASFGWMRSLSRPAPATAYLRRSGAPADPLEQQIIAALSGPAAVGQAGR